MMSISFASEVSSFTRFFDEDMKREFLILKDMVQILFEDRRESTELCEKLLAMKQEKEEILQRLHDMDLQLHQAQEALIKNMREKEVIHSDLSSVSSLERCVGSFEKHTRGVGSKLMIKMDYEGKGSGKHAQGMIEPLSVEERPKNLGLGYEQSNGEDSKAMKACEANSKRTFVLSSMRQICQVCFKDDCYCFKPFL